MYNPDFSTQQLVHASYVYTITHALTHIHTCTYSIHQYYYAHAPASMPVFGTCNEI